MKTKEAVAAFGRRADLARALGITRQAVSRWGEDVPDLRVYQIREVLRQRKDTQGEDQ